MTQRSIPRRHRPTRHWCAGPRALLAVFTLVTLALAYLAVEAGSRPVRFPVSRAGIPAGSQAAVVASITDGDTIRVRIDGEHHAVRLLEVDAPETGHECGAADATAYVRRFVPPGSAVWLEGDVEDRDRYGRLLRYMWRADAELLNERLVEAGWAVARLYPPNDRRWATMQHAERVARHARAGIWSRCTPPR